MYKLGRFTSLSVFFSLLEAKKKKNTGGLCSVRGLRHSIPLPATELEVGRWDGKQVSPMTFAAWTLQALTTRGAPKRGGGRAGVGWWAPHKLLWLLFLPLSSSCSLTTRGNPALPCSSSKIVPPSAAAPFTSKNGLTNTQAFFFFLVLTRNPRVPGEMTPRTKRRTHSNNL